ncbi:NAD(P)H-hydrate epimerase [Desulfonispora thiosulfatigenes DSM 11270]|uniref:Bifunctional NAD(P)H-hydrate repair enzyme n=1 Tax=Desulfonispora thiosulfatigenes DSM 11270 TaxID=656914 RepID=A0A1W1V8A6_DESTI|nr:NAD(P)H-hydrate dehydratase [Desulfonispora thiosulfatigenes]SMB89582.1 NAD(P)H-hydrate epimerase [Desulfonispora thiosulfatigenes DSM 11270]
MFVVNSAEMQEIDRIATEEWGIPEIVLMENAGLKVVEEIKKRFTNLKDKKITLILGKGNNGGDGLVVARHLCNLGADIKIFLFGQKEFKNSSLVNYNIVKRLPIKVHKLEHENNLHLLRLSLYSTDVIVDGLFGTGFKGEISDFLSKIIKIINDTDCLKVAIDIPSGLNADTGRARECIKANLTVTFALPKIGLVVYPGTSFAGDVKVVDIGIPSQLVRALNIDKRILQLDEIKNNIPERDENCHKGNFGHLLVIGGSLGMMGAVHLACLSAFRMGAGLVSAAIPASIQTNLAVSLPEMITYPLKEMVPGILDSEAEEEILASIEGKSVIVIGPGFGNNEEYVSILKHILEKIDIPIVIDADGINLLARDISILDNIKAPVILTPHPGEMARLLDISTQEVQKNRIELAKKLAENYGIWVVLKGNKTVIATPKGEVLINPTGSPSLATAGSGDVLAGMIGAMLGQQSDETRAICSAVYLHGLAGEHVAETVGKISSKAGDIIKAIPIILEEVLMDK